MPFAMCVLALVLGIDQGGFLDPAASAGPVGAVPHPVAVLREFQATDLKGQRWTAERLRGRVVLLDFWATWCAPCLAELPRLKALRERYRREDFEILGISLDASSRLTFVAWLNRNRIDWPQVHERSGYAGSVPRRFGVDRLPRTILLDREGRIAAMDLRGRDLATAVERLMNPPESKARK